MHTKHFTIDWFSLYCYVSLRDVTCPLKARCFVYVQPHINGKKPQSPADYLSYTVSAPSGRATTLFSTDGTYCVRAAESRHFASISCR